MKEPKFDYVTEKVLDTTIEQGEIILKDKNDKPILKDSIKAKEIKISGIRVVVEKIG